MSAQPYRELEAERELHLVPPLTPPAETVAPAALRRGPVDRYTVLVSTLAGMVLAVLLHGGYL
jgi:hypothetical protein